LLSIVPGTALIHPITGIAACCALATIGHVTALPSPAMKSRRRIRHLPL
jgi:hypothetical protein